MTEKKKPIPPRHPRSSPRRPKMSLNWINKVFWQYERKDSETNYRIFFEHCRWEEGEVECPVCGNTKNNRPPKESNLYKRGNADKHRWKCGNSKCRSSISVISKTFMSGKKIDFEQWFNALYFMMAGKGVSSALLAEYIGVSRETAWYMILKIGHLARQDENLDLGTDVAIDEAYISGKPDNKHDDVKQLYKYNYIPIVGMIGRNKYKLDEDGNIIGRKNDWGKIVGGKKIHEHSKIFIKAFTDKKQGEKITTEDVIPLINAHIPSNTTKTIVQTDQSKIYQVRNMFGNRYHVVVNHKKNQYVKKQLWSYDEPDELDEYIDFEEKVFTTNDVESVFGALKQVLRGVHNSVSPYHIQKYINIFCFRWNHRHLPPLERARTLAKQMAGSYISEKELKAPDGKTGRKTSKEIKEHTDKYYFAESEEMRVIIERTIKAVDPEIAKKLFILLERNGEWVISSNYKKNNRNTYNKLLKVLDIHLDDDAYKKLMQIPGKVRKEFENKKEQEDKKLKAQKKEDRTFMKQEISRLMKLTLDMISPEDKENLGITKNGKLTLEYRLRNYKNFNHLINVLYKNRKFVPLVKTRRNLQQSPVEITR